jgi:hypothetical protein
LAAVLEEHPDVWIPHNKEIHFFNDRLVYSFEYKYPRGIDNYRTYFKDAPENVKLGELSPFYYYDPQAAHRIHKHFPNTKILICLRDPASMLHSLYLLLRRRERREPTFEEELIKNPQLVDLCFYHRLLTPYFDWFPREQIYVSIYEDFFADEKKSIGELFEFLEIDPGFVPSFLGKRVNWSEGATPSAIARMRGKFIDLLNTKPMIPVKELMHRLKINRMDYSAVSSDAKAGAKPKLSNECRRSLIDRFEPDTARLETLLGRSLEGWRKF